MPLFLETPNMCLMDSSQFKNIKISKIAQRNLSPVPLPSSYIRHEFFGSEKKNCTSSATPNSCGVRVDIRRYQNILLMVQKSGKLTSWYGKYPHYLIKLYTPSQVVVWDFFHQPYQKQIHMAVSTWHIISRISRESCPKKRDEKHLKNT